MYFSVKGDFCKFFKLSKVTDTHSGIPRCYYFICYRIEVRSNSFGPWKHNSHLKWLYKSAMYTAGVLTPCPDSSKHLKKNKQEISFNTYIYWFYQMLIYL